MPAAPSTTHRLLTFQPALDGVRGIAVLTVVVWHMSYDLLDKPLPWLTAGSLGVDLFFALSGFLITALMLNEHHRTGSISFTGFYRRRAYRLLPALIVFLAGYVVFAVLADLPPEPDTFLQVGLAGDDVAASVVSAAFFVFNIMWFLPIDATASLGIGHLWSLSVEEQFYVVWPLLTVLMLSARRRNNIALSVAAAATLAGSAHWYGWAEQAGPTRWVLTLGLGVAVCGGLLAANYYLGLTWKIGVLVVLIAAVLTYRLGYYEPGLKGLRLYTFTLSRADSLIVGAVLAYLWTAGWIAVRAPMVLVVAAWGLLIWAATQKSLGEPFFFRFGWTAIAIASAIAVWGSLGEGDSILDRLLTVAWLRSIGRVAYGLYLWHALVFIATKHWLGEQPQLTRVVVGLLGTTIVTSLSWFLVEKPMIERKNSVAERVAAHSIG